MFPAATAAVSCSSSSHSGVVPHMIGCCLSFSSHRQAFRLTTQPSIIGSTNFTGGGGGRGLYNLSISFGVNHSTKKRIKHSISSSSSSAASRSRSRWNDDDNDYEVESGERVFNWLEEQDIVTFLDPPKQLIPLDPSSYNPAAYLWKKIEAVPEERRHRLLHLLQPRLISRAWEIAGTKYEEDPSKLAANQTASTALLLSDGDSPSSSSFLEFWNCRTSGGPIPLSWINFFKKAIFLSKDGMTCGRLLAGPIVGRLANSFAPLYFTVSQVKEVMSTEHPCDFAYNFGDGLSDIHEYPSGFPKPAKHPWPFNDQVVIYVRHLGPGVLVGQAWQEGEDLKKPPQKLCGEILMVKDYATLGDDR